MGVNTIATRIKQLRGSLGWTQNQVAKYLDVPLGTYRGWEGGRQPHHPKLVVQALTLAFKTKYGKLS